MTGRSSFHAGLAAEHQVARQYEQASYAICAHRWRGRSGEIDLIARRDKHFVFVEVKRSSSHEKAAALLSERQMRRIWNAGEEYLSDKPLGQDDGCRIDLALVDAMGRVEIIENAYMA